MITTAKGLGSGYAPIGPVNARRWPSRSGAPGSVEVFGEAFDAVAVSR